MEKASKTKSVKQYDFGPLAELHSHLGASVNPRVLWEIAHDKGIKLPKRDYHEFADFVLLSTERKMHLNDYFKEVYHPILDPLTSGTHAVEQATYQTISGGYRTNGIVLMELRNNLIKHAGGINYDLDHVAMAMLRGMERALLAYQGLSAGLIFCMAREFDIELNTHIVNKAIKYHKRGVVGIDVAGPGNSEFHFKDYTHLFDRARAAGLGVTVHAGEQKDADDMWEALEFAQPSRIGHGIRCAYDVALMKELVKRDVVLEVCPLSNIATKAVEGIDEMRHILRTLIENKVKFCINTDWPEIIEGCHLQQQFVFLVENDLMSEEEIRHCNKVGFEASFVPRRGGLEAYL